jgi:hypothetical protein
VLDARLASQYGRLATYRDSEIRLRFMNEIEVIDHAATMLLALTAAGVSATAQGVAERGGAQIYDAAADLWERLRHRFHGRAPNQAAVKGALRAALDEGEITKHELTTFIQLGQRGGMSIVNSRFKNAIGSVHTRTFNA